MSHDDTTNTTDREDASDLQRWIDGLLRSSDAADLETAPLTARVAATSAIKKLRTRRICRHSLAVFAAAAATVAAIAMWPSTLLPRREGATEHGRPESTERRAVVLAVRSGEGLKTPLVHHAPESPATVVNPSPSPSLRERGIFVTGADAIAMELESGSPDVTVVEVLPTIGTERQWRRDLALQYKFLEPSGG